jgi:hypothetical protein
LSGNDLAEDGSFIATSILRDFRSLFGDVSKLSCHGASTPVFLRDGPQESVYSLLNVALDDDFFSLFCPNLREPNRSSGNEFVQKSRNEASARRNDFSLRSRRQEVSMESNGTCKKEPTKQERPFPVRHACTSEDSCLTCSSVIAPNSRVSGE